MTQSLLIKILQDDSDLILFAIQVANRDKTHVTQKQIDAARNAAKRAFDNNNACVCAVSENIRLDNLKGYIEIDVYKSLENFNN